MAKSPVRAGHFSGFATATSQGTIDDYIADVDAYAEGNAIVFRLIDCKSMNACLKLYRSSDRFNGA